MWTWAFGSKLKQQYGFLVDPSTKLWENALIDRPTNMACHNLCSKHKAQEGIIFILGLEAKYCVQHTSLDPHQLDKTMERLQNIVRWKYIFRNQIDGRDYLPELSVHSKRNSDKRSLEIERCINEFQRRMRNKRGNVAVMCLYKPNTNPKRSD